MAAAVCNPPPPPSFRLPPPPTRNFSLRAPVRLAAFNQLSHRMHIGPRLGFRLTERGCGCSSRRFAVRCGLAEITESEFPEKVLKSEVPVLVEFVANWCGPCRLIAPAVEWASQEYQEQLKIVKIDHDSNPKLIEEYKVYGLPTLILFKDGQEVPQSRREGAITKVKLKEYLDSQLASVTAS